MHSRGKYDCDYEREQGIIGVMTGSTTMLRWLAALLVFVLLVIVGLLAWFVLSTSPGQVGDPIVEIPPASEQPVATAPSGVIYFRAYDAASKRTYPLAYNVDTQEYENVPHEPDKYYFDFYPDAEFSAALYGTYLDRPEEDNRLPYTGVPQFVMNDLVTDLQIVDSGNLQQFADTEYYAFQGMSWDFTYNNPMQVFLAPENYSDIINWSIYINVPGERYGREVRGGVDPVWAKDGKSVYYLGVDGIYRYEIETELVTQIARLVDSRYPTPISSLELSSDGTRLYVLFSSDVLEADELHRYNLVSANEAELIDVSMLPQGKRYMHLTIAPDNAYALVTSRRSGSFDVNIFDLRTEEVDLVSYFTWELRPGVFHYVYPKWFGSI